MAMRGGLFINNFNVAKGPGVSCISCFFTGLGVYLYQLFEIREGEQGVDGTLKKKMIIVNGSSFAQAMRILGIGIADYPMLYRILTKEIGAIKELAAYPVMWVSMRMHQRAQYDVRSAGFNVLVPTEDAYLGKMVGEYLRTQNFENIGEIVLVANSTSYFHELLLEIAEMGIDIYIVATRETDPDRGQPHLSDKEYETVISMPHFYFVELGQYEKRIMKEPRREHTWSHYRQRPSDPNRRYTFLLTYELTPGADPEAIETFLTREIGRFLVREGSYVRSVNFKVTETSV